MARYDRIALVDPPVRERVFSAWTVLRDLEADERSTELGRRVRLRFLALRPVRRLLERGLDRVAADSFERQVDGAREELGLLSARDPERARLAAFLDQIRPRAPLDLATATLDMGEFAEAAGDPHAAGEFYRTGLEIAERHELLPEQVIALRLLGRVCRRAGDVDEAERHYRRAAETALGLGDRRQWARALDALATLLAERGDAAGADGAVAEIGRRATDHPDDEVQAIAAAADCARHLRTGDFQGALERGSVALRASRDEADRARVLDAMARAFRGLGLPGVADLCYQVIRRSADNSCRLRATAERAVLAAERGDAEGYRGGRETVLAELGPGLDPRLRAQAHLLLARGAVRLEQDDPARDHLREALALAQRHGLAEVSGEAEGLLQGLEENAGVSSPRAGTDDGTGPGEAARLIALEIEALAAAADA